MAIKKTTAVLMPVFNGQSDLLRSLESLADEIPAHDVFVVDDGSTEPVLAPAGYPVRIIRLPRNLGIVAALNAGLKEIVADGYDYVARLDAGDLCMPGRLTLQQAFLDAHPDVALVGGWARFVDMKGADVFLFQPPATDRKIRRAMSFNSAFCHPAVMMRASVIKVVGGYDPSFQYAEDYELFRRMMERHQAANVQETVLTYDVNPNGISMSRRKKLLDARWRVQCKYFEAKSLWCWLGILQTTVLRMVPNQALLMFKRWRGRA